MFFPSGSTYAHFVHYTGSMSTDSSRKSRALAAKKASAEAQGVTIVPGGIVAYKGRDFVVYVWDESEKDYVESLRGTLDG